MFGHRHKWTDWNITERGSIMFIARPNVKAGHYLLQSRHCLRCGKTQIDRQEAGLFQNGVHQLVAEARTLNPQHDKVKS